MTREKLFTPNYCQNVKTTEQRQNIETAKEKHQLTYKGKPIRITSGLLTETVKARKEWNDIFQAMK
jgi:hypothetical protein